MFHAVSSRSFKIDVYFLIGAVSDRLDRSSSKNNHALAHTRARAFALAHIYTHTHSGYFNRFSLDRGIPQRKTTLTLSRLSELGLSRESGFEGSRVNRHLE